jgi:hypothetical protein
MEIDAQQRDAADRLTVLKVTGRADTYFGAT